MSCDYCNYIIDKSGFRNNFNIWIKVFGITKDNIYYKFGIEKNPDIDEIFNSIIKKYTYIIKPNYINTFRILGIRFNKEYNIYELLEDKENKNIIKEKLDIKEIHFIILPNTSLYNKINYYIYNLKEYL